MTTVLFYFIGFLSSFLRKKNKPALAFIKLTGVNFSLAEKDRFTYKALLAGIKEVYFAPVLPIENVSEKDTSSSLVYDLSENSKTERINYLRFYGITQSLSFLNAKQFTSFNSWPDKITFLLITLPVQLHLLLYGIFKKDKSGLSRILINLMITKNLLSFIKKTKAKSLFMFSIYDTNSSFLSYSLMKKGIKVSQVASEVPLYKWNKIIVTDELILCSEYQKHEVQAFNETIKFKECAFFGPEAFYNVSDLYLNEPLKNNKMGFYSTGGWIRNKLGHINQGLNIEYFESKILADLNTILKNRNDLELIVYPHPRERAYFENSDNKLADFYGKFLPDINFRISSNRKNTNLIFDEVYLGICYMTTIIFERMHAHRKSVIAYFEEKGFPVKTEIENLTIVHDVTELKNYINACYS